TNLDLRDNVDLPHAGAYSELRLQATTGRLGPDDVAGRVSDFKVAGEQRGYLPLARRTTLALRGTIGALWPENWGETLNDPVPSNEDIQISYFRSFFSGGPNSNRGWPLRAIGKQGIAPFLSPGLTEAQLTAQCTGADTDDLRCRTPFGGLTLWEVSVELRQRFDHLEGVFFCDASDTNQKELTYAWEPHLSCGSGLRYITPIGPLRFDVAYRIPGLNPTEAEIEAGEDGDPGEIFGLPIGLVLGLGEAF
ncbi:MAG TPA: BamA/TamA family outer membrane protein, partial [Polyangiaceae bacterium]|nr:BamA/TamA family outer membrane protein [Polyangiaceae bacterium]